MIEIRKILCRIKICPQSWIYIENETELTNPVNIHSIKHFDGRQNVCILLRKLQNKLNAQESQYFGNHFPLVLISQMWFPPYFKNRHKNVKNCHIYHEEYFEKCGIVKNRHQKINFVNKMMTIVSSTDLQSYKCALKIF